MKEKLYKACEEFIDKKIQSVQRGIDELNESADVETKSSVGDKYETNLAMIHIEREKYSAQLLECTKMRKVLAMIKNKKAVRKVDSGSLVVTNLGSYYLGIAAGKVSVDGKDYFLISQASPIGQQLTGKSKGDTFKFNGREYEVKEVV